MKPARTMIAAVAAGLALTGCASTSNFTEQQELAMYRAHAGAPVPSFRFFGNVDRFTPLGEEAMVLWTRPKEAWLLEFYGPCHNLDFAHLVGITSQAGRVYARFDEVVVRQRPEYPPCRIREIRPLDVTALRQAEHALRAQEPPSGT